MKRIVLMGTAVAALFTAGITTAATAAASTKAHTKTKIEKKTIHVNATCKLALTTVAPSGTTGVTPGSATGNNYGTSNCGKSLSSGAARQTYSLTDAGALTGKIQHWFKIGTVYGTFTLTEMPASAPPTTTTFGAASYSGSVKITGGGGLLKGTTGGGTMSCSTTDSLHYTCTEKLKLAQTIKVAVKVHTR